MAAMLWMLVPAAYLLGSFSAAYWAGRFNGKDLRQHGSGNLGATNAGRVLGGKWFAVVFLADVFKGAIPVAAAKLLGGDAWLLIAVAAAAILGHVFTCFHGFKGGKAVATSLGALIALVPMLAGLCFVVWMLAWILGWTVFKATRSAAVGPASVLGALAVPPIRLLTEPAPWTAAQLPVTGFLIALAVLVVAKHHANIRRMFAKT